MNMENNKNCYVCGYHLDFVPWAIGIPSDEICPSCGIHFGYDDAAGGDLEKRRLIYKQWRDNWVNSGMKWWSKNNLPADFNPKNQLHKIPIEWR